MKPICLTLFLISISICIFSQPHVGYFIPKKIITVTVPFVVTETKHYQVFQDKADELKSTTVVIKVDGDILVESKMYQDLYTTLNLEPLGKAGKSFNFEIGYDSGGNGTITSVNGSQEPVTADIIRGTVNLVGGVLKLVASIFGAAEGPNKPVFRDDVREQKIVEKRIIDLTTNAPFSLTIAPKLATTLTPSVVATSSASVKVDITNNGNKNLPRAPAADAVPNGFQLQYRIPAEHQLVVTVLNNQFTQEQVVINENIFIPQTGILTFLDVPILKKNKTIEIGFNSTTGNLSKYSLKKVSQLKNVVDNTKSGLDDLSAQIKTLKADADAKKKEDDAKEKNTLKDEIDKLTLENSKLELQMQQQKLKDEMNATKAADKTSAKPAPKSN